MELVEVVVLAEVEAPAVVEALAAVVVAWVALGLPDRSVSAYAPTAASAHRIKRVYPALSASVPSAALAWFGPSTGW